MATFVGNFMCRTAMEPQFRVFSISWMKRNGVVGCLKGREYSSSFPVRYIPKTSSTPKEAQTSSPMEISEDNEVHKFMDRNVFRDEFLDGRKKLQTSLGSVSSSIPKKQTINNLCINFKRVAKEEIGYDSGFGNLESMEGPKEVVQELGTHLKDSDEEVGIRAGKTKDVEMLATELIAARAFTAVELRKKLHGKGFPLSVVNVVITDFQSRGFINDCLYAEIFSRSRWSSSGWGPGRIKKALLKKGISVVDAEKAIKLVFEDNEAGVDQDSIHGLSKLSMDHLIIKASKQWLRGHDMTRQTRKLRMIRWLQYRGFDWGVINFVLKRLEFDYPP